MNFTVTNKYNDKLYEVFDITYNKCGYPHFLIYKDGEWTRMSAKHFRPMNADDIAKELNECLKSYDKFSITI